jgi:hypothetical protein
MSSAGLEAVVDRGRVRPRSPASGAPAEAALPIEWQKLWLGTQRRPWRSLAVVPVDDGIPTVRVARALAGAGACHLGHVVELIDATSITLAQLRTSTEAWIERRGSAERLLIALGPVLTSPASLALAQAADAVILCVRLGESAVAEAQRTIEEIGRERFLGSVCLRRGEEDR